MVFMSLKYSGWKATLIYLIDRYSDYLYIVHDKLISIRTSKLAANAWTFKNLQKKHTNWIISDLRLNSCNLMKQLKKGSGKNGIMRNKISILLSYKKWIKCWFFSKNIKRQKYSPCEACVFMKWKSLVIIISERHTSDIYSETFTNFISLASFDLHYFPPPSRKLTGVHSGDDRYCRWKDMQNGNGLRLDTVLVGHSKRTCFR